MVLEGLLGFICGTRIILHWVWNVIDLKGCMFLTLASAINDRYIYITTSHVILANYYENYFFI